MLLSVFTISVAENKTLSTAETENSAAKVPVVLPQFQRRQDGGGHIPGGQGGGGLGGIDLGALSGLAGALGQYIRGGQRQHDGRGGALGNNIAHNQGTQGHDYEAGRPVVQNYGNQHNPYAGQNIGQGYGRYGPGEGYNLPQYNSGQRGTGGEYGPRGYGGQALDGGYGRYGGQNYGAPDYGDYGLGQYPQQQYPQNYGNQAYGQGYPGQVGAYPQGGRHLAGQPIQGNGYGGYGGYGGGQPSSGNANVGQSGDYGAGQHEGNQRGQHEGDGYRGQNEGDGYRGQNTDESHVGEGHDSTSRGPESG